MLFFQRNASKRTAEHDAHVVDDDHFPLQKVKSCPTRSAYTSELSSDWLNLFPGPGFFGPGAFSPCVFFVFVAFEPLLGGDDSESFFVFLIFCF